ncbi:MAG: hypothetical protein QM715_18520 [Nibricoccus sp.]
MLLLKKTRFVLSAAAAVAGFISCPARGEEATAPAPAATAGESVVKDELSLFGEFLDQNPTIEARLREKTALVNDPAFIKNHRPFGEFLELHPAIRAELAARPRWFLHREFIRQSTPPVTPEQIAEFDQFLDQHPELATQLTPNPQLLSQKEFFNRTPALQEYVLRHPEIHRTVTVLKPGPLLKPVAPIVPAKRPEVPKVRVKVKP